MRRTSAVLILLSGLSLACETTQEKLNARDKANEQRFLELEAQLERHTSRIEKLTARIEQLERAERVDAPAAAP